MVERLNVAARRQSSRVILESGRCDVATNLGLNADKRGGGVGGVRQSGLFRLSFDVVACRLAVTGLRGASQAKNKVCGACNAD